MSKELTEQWKNGTLKEGWYYLSIVPSKKCIDYYYGKDFERYNEWAITKVIAPVPTYDEWRKEGIWYTEKSHKELLKKVERLEKQLNIATKALEDYADKENWSTATTEINTDYFKYECSMYGLENNGFEDAQKALKEIDEVLK